MLISLLTKESSLAFGSSTFTANTDEKVARIKINRTGNRQGVVSATLNVGKKCSPSDPNDTSQDSKISSVRATIQTVEFKNGQGEMTPILIPLLNTDSADFLTKLVYLCLTAPQGGVKLGEPKRATLIIYNDAFWRKFFHSDILHKFFHSDILQLLLMTIVSGVIYAVNNSYFALAFILRDQRDKTAF